MSENKQKSKGKSRIGRPPKHGGYSIQLRDELIKENPHLRRYLLDCRDGLIRDVAGTEEQLSEQQRIMIDRIVSRLAICRLIEVYVERHGAFRRDRLKKDQILELEPALGTNYLAFSNSIDRALIALGLERKKVDDALDLKTYLERAYPEKDEKANE